MRISDFTPFYHPGAFPRPGGDNAKQESPSSSDATVEDVVHLTLHSDGVWRAGASVPYETFSSPAARAAPQILRHASLMPRAMFQMYSPHGMTHDTEGDRGLVLDVYV